MLVHGARAWGCVWHSCRLYAAASWYTACFSAVVVSTPAPGLGVTAVLLQPGALEQPGVYDT
jgi:hypothetical protein